MYCSTCRRKLHYKTLDNYGWCDDCNNVVKVSSCSVSYWLVAAVFVVLWAMPSGV
jgi:hypothetical protein